MLPSFGDEWKRKINLGGVSSAASQSSILNQVQAERQARAQHKDRTEKAIRIQAWYRGVKGARLAKSEMRSSFESDVMGLTGLRCLVLIGKDDEVLGKWSRAVLELGPEQVFAPAVGPHRTSWLVLIRQASLLLLQSVAARSPNSSKYLQVLNILLSNEIASNLLGSAGPATCTLITDYLMKHDLYAILRRSIESIPIKSKTPPNLLNLALLPLSTYPPESTQYAEVFAEIVLNILTIPLLPNRVPLDYLPKFISQLPIAKLDTLNPLVPRILASTSNTSKINLVAHIHMFISPRYKLLPPPAFTTYLQLSTLLINGIPLSVFKPPSSKGKKAPVHKEPDSDSDYDTKVSVVSEFVAMSTPSPPLVVDDRTKKRLQNIIAPAHLASLISITQSKPSLFPHVISYLFALTATWSSSQDEILNAVLASTSGGLVRELYRDLVRRSPLGVEANSGNVFDPVNASNWPPILLLADLYSQALLTMGDDEFFGSSSSSASGSRAVRNPLSLDELVSFSEQLLNIAFTMYWRDDQSIMHEVYVSSQVRCSWETVREKVTKCLLGIHARDSRKPFVPADHWLVTSQLDMNSFVEAAVLEEQQLSKPGTHHPRILSKRQIAAMSPRLGILNNIPFAIPFEVRVSIFRHFVMNDMASRETVRSHNRFATMNMGGSWRERVQVRRGMVSQDGFDRLGEVDLKAPIEIAFIDQFGQEEAGIDGGGVFKEFFTSLCKEVFDTDRGLWLANVKHELYPNPHAYATEPHSLNWYRFIGRILGKAMYEGILVDVAFAGFFLAKWLGRQSFLDDLSSLDPDLYNGLIFLKHYTGSVEELSLNFTMAVEEFGSTKAVDLIPNGSNIAVTKENRLTYIYLVSHYRLSKQIKQQSDAFFEGLSQMIDQKWLRMFNQQEVQILIGGVNSPIDLDDLRRNTNYGGLYDDNHETVVMFWNVVNSFDQEQRRALLRFVTSCSRPPLLGFKELAPNFSIREAGSDQYRLPTSSTCVNLLKLPRYATEKALRHKLLQAINSNAGFDLS
ncbi:hypothetical protein M413DRAFT_447711 [Hebeloma cylindrosporum]|uniref:HECT-type E3 ubiquitin transferase n=1 Tax=Hebeloma cylindrosporum TaxID=76867 RepID=A0A0C3C4B8_HEBCY|nr:hypothetical protein M413DRAFT_447711 [Hebeloma cylindrosporum h7]